MSSNNETIQDKKEPDTIKKIRVVWEEMKNHPTKRLIDHIGPTGIWILVYYICSIFMMIIINIARIGFSLEAIFTAPTFFSQLFLNYGLNAGKVSLDLNFQKIDFANVMTSAAWLFAPMIIYVLGIFLAILPASGYPQPIGDYNYLTNYQYFHHYVPFLKTIDNNGVLSKGGGFYFLIVWLPLILTIIITAVLNKRLFKDTKGKTITVGKFLTVNFLVAFAVGLQMGTLTGRVSISLIGAFQTLIKNAHDNEGYLFDGQYNPNTILITSWFINFIPMFLTIAGQLFYGTLEDSIYKRIKKNNQLIIKEYEKIDNVT